MSDALPGNVNILARPATNSGPSSVWNFFRTCQFGCIFSSAPQCAQTFISLTNIRRFASRYLRFGRWRSRFSIGLSPVRVSLTFLLHITTHRLDSQGGVLPYLPSFIVVLPLKPPESLFFPILHPSPYFAIPFGSLSSPIFVFENGGRCLEGGGCSSPKWRMEISAKRLMWIGHAWYKIIS